jgi:tetratricopeptide (TPR) repeat protein
VTARHPGYVGRALPVLEALASSASDPVLGLSACLQGISRAVRRSSQHSLASFFEERGRLLSLPDDWHSALVRSRFHRSLALFRLRQGRTDDACWELKQASAFDDELRDPPREGCDALVITENHRIVVETKVKAIGLGIQADERDDIPTLAEELYRLDPTDVETLVDIGDGHASIAEYERAARWYQRAGQLETVTGATAWYRAGQCYARLGRRDEAVNAMAHCLDLDRSAIEPREYLLAHQQTGTPWHDYS